MASQKKTNSDSKSGKSASGSGQKSRSRKSTPAPQPKPVRREVGGIVCLLLGFFGCITYFKVDALFINWFRDLLRAWPAGADMRGR